MGRLGKGVAMRKKTFHLNSIRDLEVSSLIDCVCLVVRDLNDNEVVTSWITKSMTKKIAEHLLKLAEDKKKD